MQPEAHKIKKSPDSTFRKINNWLHLWLGLASGIIVFIVCITGCIWVFNEEITQALEGEQEIKYERRPVLLPSRLLEIAAKQYPALQLSSAVYHQGSPIRLSLRKPGKSKRGDRAGGVQLNVHPYNGNLVSEKVFARGDADFFRFILNGHRALWLPYDVGRPIVNYATLIFVVILITGLIWWYPKKWNKSTRDKSFRIKWGASFKRVNLDLHNVLGFYAMIFLLCIALTGMVFGVQWFSKGVYWVTTGGDSIGEFRKLQSDTTLQTGLARQIGKDMDRIWQAVLRDNPASKGFFYSFPDTVQAASVINVTVYPSPGQFYNSRSYTFDQYTLQSMKRDDAYAVPFDKAGFGQKLRKMNFDIHIGAVLGLPGKVMAFFASLIGASLPVTGFLVWWGRRFKKSSRALRRTPMKEISVKKTIAISQ